MRRRGRVGGVLERGADAVLGHDDVAVHVGRGVEDAELGRVAPAGAVDAVAGLLGDLVAQVRPAAQGGRQARTGALGALPRVLSAVEARTGRLRRPVERGARTQHVACRPLHVGAQRARRRVHEKYTAGDRTCHVVLLNGLEVRLPQRPQSRSQEYACGTDSSRRAGDSMPDASCERQPAAA